MTAGIPLFISVFLTCAAYADQVHLKNGDRVTGKIVTSDAKTLTIKTEAMGEVKIDRDAIEEFSSDEPLNVILKGSRVVGAVRTDQGQLQIRNDEVVVSTVDLEDVEAVRGEVAQKAWDREQLRLTHPSLTDFWSGNMSVNLATASGNARTVTFGTGAAAQRATGADKIVLDYTQIYSRQSTVLPFGATANRVSGGARYDRNLHPRLLSFTMANFEYDRFQDLDLRRVLGGGLGYHVVKRERSHFDLASGFAWDHETFGTGLRRSSGEVIVSEESDHQVTSALKLFQRGVIFPNLSQSGEYRLNWDGGASLALTRLLSWNVNISNRYLSNPLPGRKKNDVLVTTGIGFNFAQK